MPLLFFLSRVRTIYYIGILVHNYFNGMISSNHLRERGYTYDPELQNWTLQSSLSDGNGRRKHSTSSSNSNATSNANSISNDDTICFQVEKIHECDGALSLEGINPSLNLLVDK